MHSCHTEVLFFLLGPAIITDTEDKRRRTLIGVYSKVVKLDENGKAPSTCADPSANTLFASIYHHRRWIKRTIGIIDQHFSYLLFPLTPEQDIYIQQDAWGFVCFTGCDENDECRSNGDCRRTMGDFKCTELCECKGKYFVKC